MSAPKIWSRDDIRRAAKIAKYTLGVDDLCAVLQFAEEHMQDQPAQPRDKGGRFASPIVAMPTEKAG